MRRIILVALVAVLIIFSYFCVVEGVQNDTFNIDIAKLEDVEEESDKMTKELSDYNEKNDKQFSAIKNNLIVAIKNYESTKTEYQDLVETLGLDEESSDELLESTNKAYQIDFLWAIIGNYARNEANPNLDLDLDLVFVESTSAKAPDNAGYIYADLKFTVKGQYMEIADFIYDLEDDDRLSFEIRDFNMISGKATFTVHNVPVESSTLSNVSTVDTSLSTNTTTSNTTNSVTTNTTNTVSTQGTATSTTNTTSVTNTVN